MPIACGPEQGRAVEAPGVVAIEIGIHDGIEAAACLGQGIDVSR